MVLNDHGSLFRSVTVSFTRRVLSIDYPDYMAAIVRREVPATLVLD